MTSIIEGGFQDWQGQSLWRDSAWYDFSNFVAANSNLETDIDRDMSFGSMMLELSVSAFAAQFDIKHTKFAGDGLPFWSSSFVLLAGTTFLSVFPLMSNIFRIGWVTPVANGNTVHVRAQRMNVATDRMHFFGRNRQMGQTDVVMANGAVNTFQPTDFLPGPASVLFRANGNPANVSIRIDCVDKDGVQGPRIHQRFSDTGISVDKIIMPHTAWLATVSNFSGANQTVTWGISMEGR